MWHVVYCQKYTPAPLELGIEKDCDVEGGTVGYLVKYIAISFRWLSMRHSERRPQLLSQN